MLVLNVKLSVKRMLGILGIISIAAAIICVVCMISIHNNVPDTATCDEIGVYSLCAKTDDDMVLFLKQFGLRADKSSKKTRCIVIPSRFNEVYEKYNAMQRKIGLDLEKFMGSNAEEITYSVKSEKYNNIFAVILVCNDKIIGAHLTNGEYGCENMPLL